MRRSQIASLFFVHYVKTQQEDSRLPPGRASSPEPNVLAAQSQNPSSWNHVQAISLRHCVTAAQMD